ncbi:hypothetical protein [Cupriavidus sp. L7L]|uniref:hypothetical protein n=1 Tax=Cupriavidus sp. L7L TaxID=2546443 RepID=UPI00140468D5|nr:hypothetical protein [Cupriavidus sp. L7L]
MDTIAMSSQTDLSQASVSDHVPRELEAQTVLPASNLDLNAVNSAMSRFFD